MHTKINTDNFLARHDKFNEFFIIYIALRVFLALEQLFYLKSASIYNFSLLQSPVYSLHHRLTSLPKWLKGDAIPPN